MLNKIWAGFIITGFVAAIIRAVTGDTTVFADIVGSTFTSAKTAFEISLGLTGVMCLWLGIMRVGEKGGVIKFLASIFSPLLRRLFPSIPKGHAAEGSLIMNMAANMMGLDNAATPLGLKAMREMQSLNPTPERATDDQILFLVINTSAVTLLPVTIFTYRAQMGAADPTDVFLPILIATFCSTMAGLLFTAAVQKRNLMNKTVVSYLGAMTLIIAGLVFYFTGLNKEAVQAQSALIANALLFTVITSFVVAALVRKVAVFEEFVEGAKEGFKVAVGIIPYLVAMLVAIGILRSSGALDFMLDGIRIVTGNPQWIDSIPTALMKPLSGSGARGMMIEAMQTHGADSFTGRLSSIIQGSTETTFYVLAVYFGAVKIRFTRHAVLCGLVADLAGIIAAIFVCYLFFN
ncbi:MAG: spore maturation protein [bacterium]|nr:spore maturation protein [bacterium]MCP4801017.1 spore maturation protein [bacterium]